MGGIRNKLTSKAKTLFNSLPLAGEMPVAFRVGAHLASQKCDDKRADEMTKSSQSREGNNNKTIPLSDYRLTSPFSQRGTKNAVNKGSLSLKGSGSPLGLTEGSLSTGLSLTILTKYLGIACLSLAILSTLVLNIISSYSNSSTRSNAEPVSNGSIYTLANNNDSSTCDPSNTNAASCISLSITSSPSTSTGGNDANLSLSIPQGGGIATGRHTVSVSSNNVAGYYVMLTGNAGSPAMTPSATTSQAFINPSSLDKGQWGSWGIALPNSSLYTGFNTNEADYNSTNQDVLTRTTWAAVPGKEAEDGSKTIIKTTTQSRQTDTYPVYYGVRVDSPVSVPADTYTAQVVYTATTNEVPMPTITSTSSNTYELGSGADSTVTITGTNLASTYKVYIESNTDSTKQYDITSTITNLTDTGLTVTIPTDQTNPDLEAGDYTIHVVTQGGEGSAGFSYTEPALPAGVRQVTADYGSDGHVAVDFDEHMIPVKYTGNTTTPRWEVVTDAELEDNPANWFSYTADKKQWANAVTVTESSLQEYLNAEKGSNQHYEVDNDDILGYWVYIPRYAYEVMRRDAIDAPITTPETFDIKFEVSGDVKKVPVRTCSTVSSHRDYRSCNGVNRSYGNETGTTWATHPAFTFGEEELNGFWVGKFLTTGEISAPTVKPNQQANLGNTAGEYYAAAKSIGKEDKNNVGGSLVSGISYNSHNMVYTSSTLVRNSEWGATAYLAMSKFGQGDINNIYANKAGGSDGVTRNTDRDGDAQTSGAQYGITGCGALTLDDPSKWASLYNDGTRLNVSRYESATACSTENTQRSYNGTYGVVSSTTGNVYGLYDFNASSRTYVAANLTSSNLFTTSNSTVFAEKAGYPYVDLYYTGEGFNTRPSWSNSTDSQKYNNDVCTWETCGGQAMYEVSRSQSLSDDDAPVSTWANTALGGASGISMFVDSSLPWVIRAGFYVGSSPVAYDTWDGSVSKSLGVYYRISMHL